MRPEHLALWRTGDVPPSSTRSTNWFRKREMPSTASHASVLIAPSACFPLSCPAPSFSFSYDGTESIGTFVQVGLRSSYSSGSLSRRKIYVNRHVDTCLNVAGARARAERNEERDREKGLEVGLLVCSVGFRGVPDRVKGEKRTPRDAVARRRVYTHTRARHARSACRPSHESKLFVTGGNGQRDRRREDIRVCLQ